jgi:hypothetical protein
MRQHLAGFTGTDQIVFVGVAQEKAHVFRTERRRNPVTGAPYPWIVTTTAMVNHYYFYGVDDDFGPFFLKFCSYFPYTAQLCINGNESVRALMTMSTPSDTAACQTADRKSVCSAASIISPLGGSESSRFIPTAPAAANRSISSAGMRCVKRRLSDVVYRQLVADAEQTTTPAGAENNPDGAGLGGHPGTTTNSSVTGLTPDTGTSDQPQPEPAPTTLAAARVTHQTPAPGTAAQHGGVQTGVSAQPDERR